MNESIFQTLDTPREIVAEFVRTLWSRKWLILIVFLATVLSAYAYLQLLTERYQSEATLLVTIGRENTELPVSVARGSVTTLGVRPEEINSNVTLLKSKFLVADVVDELGPEAFEFELPEPTTWLENVKYQVKSAIRWVKKQYQEFLILIKIEERLTERQQTIEYVHKFLEVDRVRDSDTIRVAVVLPDPALAQKFQSVLLEKYFDRHVNVRSMALSNDFFQKQVDVYRGELDKLDNQIVDLRTTKDLSAVDQQRGLVLERLAKIKEELSETRSQLSMLSGSDSSTAGRDESDSQQEGSESLFPVYQPDKLQEYAMDKYLSRLGIVAVQGDRGSQLDSIDEETERIERELQGSLARRVQQLEQWSSELGQRLESLNTGEVALQKLQRDRSLNEQTLFKYVQRLEDDRIAGELDRQRIANVAVLTPPTITFKPVYPAKKTWLIVSLVGGLIAAVGFALVLAYLDDRIREPRDIKAIEGVDVLGAIQIPRRPTPIAEVEPVG